MHSTLQRSRDCARRLQVLANPVRLNVMHQLMTGPRSVGELNRRLKIGQSLLSHHLETLRQAGLVRCQREGRYQLYRLDGSVQLDGETSEISLGCCSLVFGESGGSPG